MNQKTPTNETVNMPKYQVGQQFEKIGGDYQFRGEIVAVFTKKNGIVRYVGENEDGLLFIFNEGAISPVDSDKTNEHG